MRSSDVVMKMKPHECSSQNSHSQVCSTYGIFAYKTGCFLGVKVGRYTIHWVSGLWFCNISFILAPHEKKITCPLDPGSFLEDFPTKGFWSVLLPPQTCLSQKKKNLGPSKFTKFVLAVICEVHIALTCLDMSDPVIGDAFQVKFFYCCHLETFWTQKMQLILLLIGLFSFAGSL